MDEVKKGFEEVAEEEARDKHKGGKGTENKGMKNMGLAMKKDAILLK